MNRRSFIKQTAIGGLALSTLGLPRVSFAAPDRDTIFVSIFLSGGPDLRYLLVPPYDSSQGSYGNTFWQKRARTYGISSQDTTAQEDKWNEYLHLNSGGVQFGIHNRCGWLKSQFDSGNVAIINNMFGSTNRDHAHSTLMLETGDTTLPANASEHSGWGGRLAKACDRNIISLSDSVRQFCYGPHPLYQGDHDNSIVIDGRDSRQMGLYEYNTDLGSNEWRWHTAGIMSRALTSYYAAKALDVDQSSPYHQILQHEQTVRSAGRVVAARLDALPLPQEIIDLYTGGSANELNSHYFARQIRNIYDLVACEDILLANIFGAQYSGWDHHSHMYNAIEPMLEDLFGTGKGLDTLYTQLAANQSTIPGRLVVLIHGEFGRQLAANGDYGTDHGVGNHTILIGNRINGGIYGDMFPASEIPKFDQAGTNIEGLTSFLQLFGRCCEHLKTGSGDTVIPGWQSSTLENGLNLSNLFT